MAWQAALNGQLLGAVRARNCALVKQLLSRGGSPNSAEAPKNLTALHIAADNGHHEIFRELKKAGANLKACTTDNITVLHKAALHGHKPIINMLLQAGCDPDERSDCGWTAVHWACSSRQWEAVAMLLDNSAALDIKDNHGRTPLHMLAEMGELLAINKLLDAMLLDRSQGRIDKSQGCKDRRKKRRRGKGAPADTQARPTGDPKHKPPEKARADLLAYINTPDDNLETPLLTACKHDRGQLPVWLLDRGAQPDARDINGNTALHLAASCGCAEVLSHLIQSHWMRPLLNSRNNVGETPLYLACLWGHVAVVKVLLQHHADIHLMVQGRTALHIALDQRRLTCIGELLAAGADPTMVYGAEARRLAGVSPLQQLLKNRCFQHLVVVLATPATLSQLLPAEEGEQQQRQQEAVIPGPQDPEFVLGQLADGVQDLLFRAYELINKPGDGPTPADLEEAALCQEQAVSCCHAVMSRWGVTALPQLLEQVAYGYHVYGAQPAILLLQKVHSRWLGAMPWLQRKRGATNRLQQLVIQPQLLLLQQQHQLGGGGMGLAAGAGSAVAGQQQGDVGSQLWSAAKAAADAGNWAGAVAHLQQLVGVDNYWAQRSLTDLAAGNNRERLGVVALCQALLAAWWALQPGTAAANAAASAAAKQLKTTVVAAVQGWNLQRLGAARRATSS